MANQKISDLASAGALGGTELMEVVQGGVNKQTTAQAIANLAPGGGGGTWGSITGTLSSQTDLQAALDAKADSVLTPYTKSASYELDTADVTDVEDGKRLNFNMDVATANTFTIPPDSEHDFPIGTVILVDWVGAGQPTITPGAGVTFQGGRYKLSEQYAGCSCKKVAANTWRIQGSLTS